ncbi:muscarinic acetylcholine receptor M3-like [Acanthaster planci]|uniref:Muscarinic acetylcholine receptor M3-like n=1 Tax=Acanthaster planci TaxID=133434 RepID=A0A8B7YN17_ACAPL|nr:muscarinic acetylcholine receptor M3-like [Acanthaster planci]XP_022092866.1 muscarinic acetylcholine receptor M3-like [Acanthaster planci]
MELTVTVETMDAPMNCTGVNCTDEPDEGLSNLEIIKIICMAILSAIASLITICGNALVIVAFCRERRLRCLSNYFIISMASADVIIGAFSMPLYTMYLLIDHWPLGPVICDIWLFVDYLCCGASVLGILLISVDRYRCLSHPMTYRSDMTRARVLFLIIASWITTILLFGVPIVGWQFFEGKRTVPANQCEVQFTNDAFFTAGSIIMIYWLPLVVILILYIRIYLLTRHLVKREARIIGRLSVRHHVEPAETSHNNNHHDRKFSSGVMLDSEDEQTVSFPTRDLPLPPHPEEDNDVCGRASCSTHYNNGCRVDGERRVTLPSETDEFSESDRTTQASHRTSTKASPNSKDHTIGKTLSAALNSLKEAKAVRTLSAILGIFIVCWTPYSVLVIVKGFCPDCVNTYLYELSYFLCYINSTCNPMCYAFANRDFKIAFKKILLCDGQKYGWKANHY